jgi:hypothetical protein
MAVVRDPVDRLLSGFIYMCITGEQVNTGCKYECYGCGKNMTCWIEEQYKKLKEMAKNPDKKFYDHPTEHSYPQQWRCDFKNDYDKYELLHYKIDSEEFYPIVREYLQKRNVSSQALDYIGNKMTNLRTTHSTALSSIRPFLEERLRSSSYLIEMVVRMYHQDFKLFNFELPSVPDN